MNTKQSLRSLLGNSKGSGFVEKIIIIALFAFVIAVGVRSLGDKTKDTLVAKAKCVEGIGNNDCGSNAGTSSAGASPSSLAPKDPRDDVILPKDESPDINNFYQSAAIGDGDPFAPGGNANPFPSPDFVGPRQESPDGVNSPKRTVLGAVGSIAKNMTNRSVDPVESTMDSALTIFLVRENIINGVKGLYKGASCLASSKCREDNRKQAEKDAENLSNMTPDEREEIVRDRRHDNSVQGFLDKSEEAILNAGDKAEHGTEAEKRSQRIQISAVAVEMVLPGPPISNIIKGVKPLKAGSKKITSDPMLTPSTQIPKEGMNDIIEGLKARERGEILAAAGMKYDHVAPRTQSGKALNFTNDVTLKINQNATDIHYVSVHGTTDGRFVTGANKDHKNPIFHTSQEVSPATIAREMINNDYKGGDFVLYSCSSGCSGAARNLVKELGKYDLGESPVAWAPTDLVNTKGFIKNDGNFIQVTGDQVLLPKDWDLPKGSVNIPPIRPAKRPR